MGEFSNEVWDAACRAYDAMEPSQEIPMLCRAILAERQRGIDACRRLADHLKGGGQLREAFTAKFIAQQLADGAHTPNP